jgi:hypothetical protein
MEAKELRIGNYVENDIGNVIFIDSETLPFIVTKWIKCHHSIELTEEWLLKFNILFGFNYCGSQYELELGLNGYYLRLNYDLGMSKYIGSCKYVHQLQNLYYALTNEELTIKS